MPSSRQLAAIMFTDIVGYTALMGKDEQKAFELLDKNRQIQKPVIEQYNGKWIKELGDGVMASFNTVSDAVYAAIKIQEQCNAAKDFQLRIGIHLGEVVFENDDVFGDGVNIASRIQVIAEPASIYISESVHQNISNKIDVNTQFVKQETFKNVKEPVRVYEILMEQMATSSSVRPISEKSIAVLPFTNMSSDPEQEYFSDGITEDIITHISKIHELKVISRTSVIQYKQTQKSLPQIASELKVSYLLEGSVRKAGNRLRIVSQLIDAKKDEHLWAETFDRDLIDIFAIQSEIASKVADGLKARLTNSEKKRIAEQPTSNLEAYNLYLLGRSHYHKATPEDFEKAIEYYNKAISLDADFALAYSSLAVAVLYKGAGYFGVRPHDAMPKALACAKKALELNPDLSHAHNAIGEVNDWYLFDWKTAEQAYKKAIELNPSNADAHLYLAIHLLACRRIDRALAETEQALQLDPHSLLIRMNCIFNQMFARQYQLALKEARSVVLLDPNNGGAWALYGIAQSHLGQFIESVTSLKEADRLSGRGNYFVRLILAYVLARAHCHDEAASLLRELHDMEEKEFVWPMGFAIAYAHLGETEKALSYLERSFEERVGWMLLIGADPGLDILRKEPRFKELVRKIGPPEAIAEIDKFG